MNFLGLDVGGANLKCATLNGDGAQVPFPFWRRRESFGVELGRLVASLPGFHSDGLNFQGRIGVTMTAELADCFEDKREGVCFIVDQIEACLADCQPRYYQTSGMLVDAATAKSDWQLTAASNWHASTSFLSQTKDVDSGFMIDVGSTTTDIIPFRQGRPVVERQTDFDRLANGQLLYLGVGRTPVCSVLGAAQLNGKSVGVAREWFATVDDARIWLNETPERPDDVDTCDGRAADRRSAAQRLARMVCADAEDLGEQTLTTLAEQVRRSSIEMMAGCIEHVIKDHPSLPQRMLLTGSGSGWARQAIEIATEGAEPDIHLVDAPGAGQMIPAQAVAFFRSRSHGSS